MAGDGRSLLGKVAVVTGARNGLGRVAAETLARGGARVFLVCRDERRGILVGDLSSQRSVRAVASAFLSWGEPLHILLNNAGGMCGFRRQMLADGFKQC